MEENKVPRDYERNDNVILKRSYWYAILSLIVAFIFWLIPTILLLPIFARPLNSFPLVHIFGPLVCSIFVTIFLAASFIFLLLNFIIRIKLGTNHMKAAIIGTIMVLVFILTLQFGRFATGFITPWIGLQLGF